MKTLLVLTDGRRDCLTATLSSAEEMLDGFDDRVIVCDDPAPDAVDWLTRRCPGWRIIPPQPERRGFGGAIATGWAALDPTTTHVFHLEDDFVFRRPVPIEAMARVIDRYLHLAQVSLMRQAWNPDERAAGGLVALHPEWYTPCADRDGSWLEQRAYFTTNPCLYRYELTRKGWPDGARSEGRFTHRLLEEGRSFAVWGAGEEWVTHIGDERVGTGY